MICKHEAQEIVMGRDDVDQDDLQAELNKLNRELDIKRKAALKSLKAKLSQIINDES